MTSLEARPTAGRRSRRVILGAVRGVLAVLPFVWLSHRVVWPDVLHDLSRVSPEPVIVAMLCAWVAILAGTLRWRYLLRAYGSGPAPGYWAMLRHNLVGVYFNVLPLGVAGDAVRGYRLRAESGGLVRSYYVLLVERLCGLAGLFALGLLAEGLARGTHSTQHAVWTTICALGLLALALGALLAVWLARVSTRVERLTPRLQRWLSLVRQIVTPRRLRPFASALALSLVTQGVTVLGWLSLVMAFAPGVRPLETAGALIGVVLLTFVPITPAALGQRELVTTYQLAPVGVVASAAVTSSLLWLAVTLTLALGGGCVYVAELVWLRRAVPSSSDASS